MPPHAACTYLIKLGSESPLSQSFSIFGLFPKRLQQMTKRSSYFVLLPSLFFLLREYAFVFYIAWVSAILRLSVGRSRRSQGRRKVQTGHSARDRPCVRLPCCPLYVRTNPLCTNYFSNSWGVSTGCECVAKIAAVRE